MKPHQDLSMPQGEDSPEKVTDEDITFEQALEEQEHYYQRPVAPETAFAI